MKSISVKARITIIITVLMILLGGLMLAGVLGISRNIIQKSSMDRMEQLARVNISELSNVRGRLEIGPGFIYHQSGMNVAIHNANAALVAGSRPDNLRTVPDFESGVHRMIQGDRGEAIMILDIWYPLTWDTGMWMRIYQDSPDLIASSRNILRMGAIFFPIFILLAGIGTYMIIKASFLPLERIAETAEGINEAKDLSKRIGDLKRKDEFSRLAEVFDRLLERLENLFEAEKRFAADASHELRTPISVIRSSCEYALKYGDDPKEQEETLHMIHRQSVRMGDMVEQLLRLTRLENGLDASQLGPIDLSEVIRESICEGGFDPERIETDIRPGIIHKADPILMSRLSCNLISNALKFSPREERIKVSLKREGGKILYSVSDKGIGLSEEEISRIWQRFYQADESRSGKGVGAGLGLSYVDQICRAHGGQMKVESQKGVGSTFTMELPDEEENS